MELASCGIGPKGADYIAGSLMVNKSLIELNMGFLKSTNDLGEVPNVIGSMGAISFSKMLNINKILRSLDLVYTGIQQAGISALADTLSQKNTTLLYLNLEQFGIPHNELSREIIRKSLKRNKEMISAELINEIDMVINPPHLEEIQSVYRVV